MLLPLTEIDGLEFAFDDGSHLRCVVRGHAARNVGERCRLVVDRDSKRDLPMFRDPLWPLDRTEHAVLVHRLEGLPHAVDRSRLAAAQLGRGIGHPGPSESPSYPAHADLIEDFARPETCAGLERRLVPGTLSSYERRVRHATQCPTRSQDGSCREAPRSAPQTDTIPRRAYARDEAPPGPASPWETMRHLVGAANSGGGGLSEDTGEQFRTIVQKKARPNTAPRVSRGSR